MCYPRCSSNKYQVRTLTIQEIHETQFLVRYHKLAFIQISITGPKAQRILQCILYSVFLPKTII